MYFDTDATMYGCSIKKGSHVCTDGCPLCDSDNLTLYSLADDDGYSVFYIDCENCGMTYGGFYSADELMKRWVKRAKRIYKEEVL